ncbi:hypothetical protein MUN84_15885 [Hymenobacter sp. 5516J-16]|uniref:hypothetical protein n=1 Tax=Hymenobacter sp. 5516J-16 TaxID=2932253 RepID=UPI001FD01450|nr:hypothetical protein [Hymenobacter sp. 5516J-16]UOQ79206.1 hypothetical protein MUN84_15885 [Hymenobacter sp. 5516J-16]
MRGSRSQSGPTNAAGAKHPARRTCSHTGARSCYPPAPAAVVPASPADTTRRAPRALAAPPTVPDSARRRPAQAQLPPANTTRYAVGLKSGQVVRGYDVELKQPLLGRTFVLVDGQQRFELNDVRYYEDETGFYVRTTLPGRSKRESTLRRDRVGRISLYSITNQQYVNNPYGYSPFGYGRYGYGNPYGATGGMAATARCARSISARTMAPSRT